MSYDSSSSQKTPASRQGLFEKLRQVFGFAPQSLREDIEEALDDSQSERAFTPHERTILRNVLELHEYRVDDIMVPRADIIAVAADAPLSEVLNVFRTAGHSRLPVYQETLDDPRGMAHIRDFVDYLVGAGEAARATKKEQAGDVLELNAIDLSAPLSDTGVMRTVLFVPPSMPALDLLIKMQASRIHMALVIDEYGGTDGLVSIEDVMEMIVGDIEDEHDSDEKPLIEAISSTEFLVDARAGLEEVSQAIGIDLKPADHAEDIDTIGGLVTLISGCVPKRGEIVSDAQWPLEFEIADADPRKVKRVRLRALPQTKADARLGTAAEKLERQPEVPPRDGESIL